MAYFIDLRANGLIDVWVIVAMNIGPPGRDKVENFASPLFVENGLPLPWVIANRVAFCLMLGKRGASNGVYQEQ